MLELTTSLNTEEHRLLKIVSAYLALPNVSSELVIKDLRLTTSQLNPPPNLPNVSTEPDPQFLADLEEMDQLYEEGSYAE
jgi:hypothetical protein